VKTTEITREFMIPFQGMSLGKHKFSIVCDNTFFEAMQLSEVQDGAIVLEIEMEKQAHLLQFVFNFKGTIKVECDRCLDEMDLDLDFSKHLTVKILSEKSTEIHQEDDEIWMVGEDVHELNFEHFVYEAILCEIPLQHVHADRNSCNTEMLKRLEMIQNVEEETQTDPRWDALKTLKTKL